MTTTVAPTPQKTRTNGQGEETLSERAEEIADTVSKTVEDSLGDVQEQGEKALQEVQDTFMTVQDSAVAAVRRNPTTALLGALGVGVLLGLAWQARD